MKNVANSDSESGEQKSTKQTPLRVMGSFFRSGKAKSLILALFQRSLTFFRWFLRKKWYLPALLFLLFILAMLLVRIPVSFAVRHLLDRQAPELSQSLQWNKASYRVGQGVILDTVRLNIPLHKDSLVVKIPRLQISFSWLPLLRQKLFVEHLEFQHFELVSAPASNDSTTRKKPLLTTEKSSLLLPVVFMGISPILHPRSTSVMMDSLNLQTEKGKRVRFRGMNFTCFQCHLSTDSTESDSSITLSRDSKLQIQIDSLDLPLLDRSSDIQGRISFLPKGMQLEQLRGKNGGGTFELEAAIPMNLSWPGQAKMIFRNIPLNMILRQFMPAQAKISGKARGNLQITGPLLKPENWKGRGAVQVDRSRITGLYLQQTQFFQEYAPGFETLVFQYLHFNPVEIQDGKIHIRAVETKSSRFAAKGWGNIDLDGNLDFHMDVALPNHQLEKLPYFTRLAAETPGKDSGLVSVVITGNLDEQNITPKGSAVKKAAGNQLRRIGRSIMSIFD